MPETAKSTFRIPKPNLRKADEIGKRIGANRTEVVNLAIDALADRLGLTQQDAAFAADRLAAKYGDDLPLVVEVKKWVDNGQTIDAEVSLTINGEEQPDWSILFSGTTKVRLRPERPGTTTTVVHVVHLPSEANFVLGALDVKQGASISVRIRDLPDHVVALPSQSEMSEAELRRHVRDAFRLRRILRLAEDQNFTETELDEEVSLPDDDD